MNSNNLTYNTGWHANGLTWSNRSDAPLRFAVGSFLQEYKNTVDIVEVKDDELVCRGTWTHCYPPTKLMFAPESNGGADLLISTADYLRLWEIRDIPEGGDVEAVDVVEPAGASTLAANEEAPPNEGVLSTGSKASTINTEIVMKKVFDFGKPNDFCSPVTSCDWNSLDTTMVGCCSIDTTVTIWDLEKEKHVIQLIAHDKDVYDIAFSHGNKSTFASCGADGAVRLFDLREMEHCTIVWESPSLTPLLRVAWSKQNANYLSTFGINDTDVAVVDVRYPSTAVCTLAGGHRKAINSVAWAPHSAEHLCSAGEDGVVNIWGEVGGVDGPSRFLTYDAPANVNNVSWSRLKTEYMGITAGTQAQVLRI